MYKLLSCFIFIVSLNTQPLFSQNDSFNINIGTTFNSKNVILFHNKLRSQNKGNIYFNLKYSKKEISTQFTLNFDEKNTLNFDDSYVNYKKGMANLNIGKVDRIWSFS
jgi:hypothetical protein